MEGGGKDVEKANRGDEERNGEGILLAEMLGGGDSGGGPGSRGGGSEGWQTEFSTSSL